MDWSQGNQEADEPVPEAKTKDAAEKVDDRKTTAELRMTGVFN